LNAKRRGQQAAPSFAICEAYLCLQVLLVALDHLLDHLAADGTGLARGEIAVVALLEVDANLPWCTPVILKCPFTHVLRYDEGKGAMRIAM